VITTTVTRGRAALRLHDPTKEAESTRNRETEEQLNEGQQGARVVSTPLPGVWGLIFFQCTSPGSCSAYADTTKYQTDAEVVYTVRAVRTDGDGTDGKLATTGIITPPADSTVPFTTSVSFTNQFAAVPKAELRAELGLYLQRSGRIFGDSADKPLDVTIDSGTTSLRIRATADVPAGAEIFLYDCTGRTCELWDARRRDSKTQDMLVLSPTPGRWKVVLDGAEAPAAGSPYTLEVVRTAPRYGEATPGPLERVGTSNTQRAWVMAWWRGAAKDTAWSPALVTDFVDPATFEEVLARPLAKPSRKPSAPTPLATVVTKVARRTTK
jgi:hypothetical protein